LRDKHLEVKMTEYRLQPVHCFWCKQPRGDSTITESHDPRDYVTQDYKPCGDCLLAKTEGVSIIEVAFEPQERGQPALLDGLPAVGKVHDVALGEGTTQPLYPTGNWLVFDPKGLSQIFDEDLIGALDETGFEQILLPVEQYQGLFSEAAMLFAERELVESQGGLN
jgi:hypothetical protein